MPLSVAVGLGKDRCREMVIALFSGGAHLDFRTRQGQTAMHKAVLNGSQLAVKVTHNCEASCPTLYLSLSTAHSKWYHYDNFLGMTWSVIEPTTFHSTTEPPPSWFHRIFYAPAIRRMVEGH